MLSRVTITYNGNKTLAHYTSIGHLICPIKWLLFQLVYDNSLKSDMGFYGLSSVNLYDKGAKVAGLNVGKLSGDGVALRAGAVNKTNRLSKMDQANLSE